MVVKKQKVYMPKRGDICLIDFDPSLGHEQRGARPALVISNTGYTEASGLAVCCPITAQVKGYPFEVGIDTGKTYGVILVDQIKVLDITHRTCKKLDICTKDIVDRVCVYLNRLVSE